VTMRPLILVRGNALVVLTRRVSDCGQSEAVQKRASGKLEASGIPQDAHVARPTSGQNTSLTGDYCGNPTRLSNSWKRGVS
jgi:hypothetical protein